MNRLSATRRADEQYLFLHWESLAAQVVSATALR
jgi:hypothetical protein